MNYYNGFQTVALSESFVRDMRLYDPLLYVWQDVDSTFHISYNRDRLGIEHARRNEAYTVPKTSTGEVRQPDQRDLHALMRNDQRFTHIDNIVGRVKQGVIDKKHYQRKQMQELIREKASDIVFEHKRHKGRFAY